MNINSKKFNFLTFSLCLFSILVTGCGGVVRPTRLTLLPTRILPKIKLYDWKSKNSKVWLDVKSSESLQSENLAVLNKDGSLIAHPDKTWLRPISVLVDEAFREMWLLSCNVPIMTEQDSSQLKMTLQIIDCYYDSLKEKMVIRMRIVYELSAGNTLQATYDRECNMEELQKTLLDVVWDCLEHALWQMSGQTQVSNVYV